VEDHPVLRQGIVEIIKTQPDLVVCGEAEDRQQALAMLTARLPDLAIVDLMLKDSDGLELIKDMQVSCPQVAVLVFSMHREWVYAERVLRAGAQGYLNKQEAAPRLLEAIRCILAGQVYLSSQMAYQLATKVIGHPLANGASLSIISDR
jgi:DNA-binding NarL/FixJ family response regulator